MEEGVRIGVQTTKKGIFHFIFMENDHNHLLIHFKKALNLLYELSSPIYVQKFIYFTPPPFYLKNVMPYQDKLKSR